MTGRGLLVIAGLLAAVTIPDAVARQHGAAGIRSDAMGGAWVMDGESPGIFWYNPAAGSQGLEGGVHSDGGYSTSWVAGSVDGVSAGLIVTGDGWATQFRTGVAGSLEVAGFRVGVATYLLENRVGGASRRTGRVDVGALRRLGPASLGVAARNLVFSPGSGPARVDSAVLIELQASVGSVEWGPLDVSSSARMGVVDGKIASGAGIEMAYWPVIGRTFRVLAGGFRDPVGGNHPTLGASFSADRITLEYGWQDTPHGEHRVGLRWQ